jgi:hypothetical protein
MPTKHFRLSADQVKPLATGYGGCFASDHILVDGHKVGFMYRETPDNRLDSGWRFMSGLEDDEFMNEPENLGFYDVNTIANYDPPVVALLDEPIGSAFAREPGDVEFSRVTDWNPGNA